LDFVSKWNWLELGTNGLPDEDEMLMMNWKETLWAWGLKEPQRGPELISEIKFLKTAIWF